jgi:hypothetical protein
MKGSRGVPCHQTTYSHSHPDHPSLDHHGHHKRRQWLNGVNIGLHSEGCFVFLWMCLTYIYWHFFPSSKLPLCFEIFFCFNFTFRVLNIYRALDSIMYDSFSFRILEWIVLLSPTSHSTLPCKKIKHPHPFTMWFAVFPWMSMLFLPPTDIGFGLWLAVANRLKVGKLCSVFYQKIEKPLCGWLLHLFLCPFILSPGKRRQNQQQLSHSTIVRPQLPTCSVSGYCKLQSYMGHLLIQQGWQKQISPSSFSSSFQFWYSYIPISLTFLHRDMCLHVYYLFFSIGTLVPWSQGFCLFCSQTKICDYST